MSINKLFLLAVLGFAPLQDADAQSGVIIDRYGAVVRGDTAKKNIALVFTGDEFADGGEIICDLLKKNQIKASFFLTGRFYDNFGALVKDLKKDGHYLGSHSDGHLLYCDWKKRDSLLVTRQQFTEDLKRSYEKMKAFGIHKADAPYFLPPYEWYNKAIADWTSQEDLQLINFTHGTRSNADYTFPDMGKRYVSSETIYQSVLNYEAKDPNGLNGFILLFHIGTDPRRTDKFYSTYLDKLISDLKNKGYDFVGADTLIEAGI